jgi:hypothetical protein
MRWFSDPSTFAFFRSTAIEPLDGSPSLRPEMGGYRSGLFVREVEFFPGR